MQCQDESLADSAGQIWPAELRLQVHDLLLAGQSDRADPRLHGVALRRVHPVQAAA